MLGARRRRAKRSGTFELAPVVGELFLAAQEEATAFRHDSIGTGHVLLALAGRNDETGRTLRCLGLELAAVRDDVLRLTGAGPALEEVFDAEALEALGIDLQAVRQRAEESFGEGALERAAHRRGSCAGAAFGVAPRLKLALDGARQAADRRGTPVSSGDIALQLARQQDSVAARILRRHAITPESLGAALAAGDGTT